MEKENYKNWEFSDSHTNTRGLFSVKGESIHYHLFIELVV